MSVNFMGNDSPLFAFPDSFTADIDATAAGRGQLEIVRSLLDWGGDSHAAYNLALIEAARRGRLEIVQLLLERGGGDVDATVGVYDEESASRL